MDYPYTSQIEGRLRELRLRMGKSRYRMLYFFDVDRTAILLHGLTKNTAAVEESNKRIGNSRMRIHEQRLTARKPFTTQSEIIRLFADLNRSMGSAVLYISHDLVSVASVCHRIAILHDGEIVECGTLDALLTRPVHPYTQQLLACVPWLSRPPAPATTAPKLVANPPKAIIPGILNRPLHYPVTTSH